MWAAIFAAILVANPMSVVAKVSPRPKTLLRLERTISMCCLTPRRSARSEPPREEAHLGQDSLGCSLRSLHPIFVLSGNIVIGKSPSPSRHPADVRTPCGGVLCGSKDLYTGARLVHKVSG